MGEGRGRAASGALDSKGIEYQLNPGDGAFYGPKIDFHIRDVLKRSWQCGTIQLDFSMPARFGLTYIGPDGQRHTPVMIHRAGYGSIERFLGIIIENYAGALPALARARAGGGDPDQRQVRRLRARACTSSCSTPGLRAEVEPQATTASATRSARRACRSCPYAIVVGENEQAAGTLNVRSRDAGELGEMTVADFLARVARRSRRDQA